MDTIIGHVDGFIAGVLHGWIANFDDLDGLERITVHDGSGQDLLVCTQFYRDDVCRMHGIQGLFGFAIKREWLGAQGDAITIRDRNGTVLSGGRDILLPESVPPASRRDALDIVLHVAKTAGTSVRHVLSRQLSEAETLLIYPGTAFGLREAIIPTIPLQQRQRLRLVIGHCSFGIHQGLDVPARYSVFLRQPAARLRSNFAHHGAARTVFRVDGAEIGLSTAINEGLIVDFDNLIVRVVAGLSSEMRPPGTIGDADVGLALQNIREHFSFVGLHETMDESFAGLCAMLGVKQSALPRDNVTPLSWPDADSQLASVHWDAVFRRNRFDMAFYEAIMKGGLVGRMG